MWREIAREIALLFLYALFPVAGVFAQQALHHPPFFGFPRIGMTWIGGRAALSHTPQGGAAGSELCIKFLGN